MMMKWRSMLSVGLITSLLSFALVNQVGAQAYYHGRWDLPMRADWMRQLPDSTRLSEMSIPGTHDSAALWNGGDAVLTQTLTITQQLKGGVRFLDLRARHVNNTFAMYHGAVYQSAMFGDVLREMIDFLRKHPSEAIVARLKEEYDPSGNTRSFEQTFKSYYESERKWFASPGRANPTLGSLRGKILILGNKALSIYGGMYCALRAQDDYAVSTNWDLYDKWGKVKAHLKSAAENRGSTVYINYLSASGGSFPYFIASGKSSPGTGDPQLLTGRTTIGGWTNSWPDFPRTACLGNWCTIKFLGTNGLTVNYLNGKSWRGLGIVAADFPGPDLIGTLIRANANTRVNRIAQASTGRCIDAEDSLRPGGNLRLMPCNGSSAQEVRIDDLNLAVGGSGSQLCLNVRSGIVTDHQSVILYGCHRDTNQQWAMREDGRIQILRRSPDRRAMCLTVEGFPSSLTVRPCGLHGAEQMFAVN